MARETEGLLKAPMMGRNDELEDLLGFLSDTISGRPSLVLVSGPAGIGKTRLLEEFQLKASSAGCKVATGKCLPGGPAPYLPFIEAFSSLEDDKSFPSSLGLNQVGDPSAVSERVFMSSLDLLQRISSNHSLLIVIEDLHWADSASIQLLHFLSRNFQNMRILIIATYRPEDILSVDPKHPHPLQDAIRIMHREGLYHEICLDLLDEKDLIGAIRGMFTGDVDEDALYRIASESGGNPLFAVETVHLLASSGQLIHEKGALQMADKNEIEIPSTVKDVLLRRIERLPENQRRVLEFASVIGEWFDPSILGRALSTDPLALLELLDKIERDHKLLVSDKNMFKFSHEKIRRVTYDLISSPRKRALHEVIGNIMEQRTAGELQYGELSMHFCGASDKEKCVRYSLLAGQSSFNGFASWDALRYYRRALTGIGDDPLFLQEHLMASEGAADSGKALSLYDLAISAYEDCIRTTTDPQAKVRILRKMAECWLPHGLAEPRRVLELLDEAEQVKDVPLVEHARMLLIRGKAMMFMGEFHKANDCFIKAERIFRQEKDPGDLGLCLLEHSMNDLSVLSMKSALDEANRALEIFSAQDRYSEQLGALWHLGMVQMHLGHKDETLSCFEKANEIGRRFGRNQQLFFVHLYQSFFMLYHLEDKESALKEAILAFDLANRMESHYLLLAANSVLANCLIHLGRIKEAESKVVEMQNLSESIPPTIRSPNTGGPKFTVAEMLAAKGFGPESNLLYEEAENLFHGGVYGYLWEGEVAATYGESLLKQGLINEAIVELKKAARLYEMMGNDPQKNRAEALISEGEDVVRVAIK
jgi:tetratricopeptide (TPR) repeat protein